ncbi:unnamed protein product [Hermetia illucens]|uniref:Schwannomin interacting protein 1 C-terminal domain-containing protein n=1 Tax=Hermetia illucens TaxID=343691 RepID=A0A7R8YUQ2_HERIL|nr:unnamed protein product [Hermetia illucens]
MEAEPVSLYAGEGKRHYKKDSRFVLDLYTLTYDEHESVDTVELFTSIVNNTAGNWVTQRRNDREEIRRRLAMGAEDDYFSKIVNQDRPGRKPSLQSRLQNGMNLQICFMNEASSDTESPSSDSETCPKLSKSTSNSSNMSRYSSSSSAHNPYHSRPLSMNRPSTLSLGPPVSDEDAEADFFTKQARLQIEARMALAQAKDMAHMQMEIERQKQKVSPITEVIRSSMEKVGVPFPPEKRRVSRQMLTDMNIAQLQIIVNDLHTQIERLNEQLVQFLMERDDLHMGQDSMLVDIEDLTRYLGAKEQSKLNEKTSSTTTETPSDFTNQNQQTTTINNSTANQQNGGVQSQSKFLRIANLVKK